MSRRPPASTHLHTAALLHVRSPTALLHVLPKNALAGATDGVQMLAGKTLDRYDLREADNSQQTYFLSLIFLLTDHPTRRLLLAVTVEMFLVETDVSMTSALRDSVFSCDWSSPQDDLGCSSDRPPVFAVRRRLPAGLSGTFTWVGLTEPKGFLRRLNILVQISTRLILLRDVLESYWLHLSHAKLLRFVVRPAERLDLQLSLPLCDVPNFQAPP